jgi:hypothetical protein
MNAQWWVTTSLDKVFQDSQPPFGAARSIELRAARNETEDAQVAIAVPEGRRVGKASYRFSSLKGPRGSLIPASGLDGRWEWYINVLHNPSENDDPRDYLRKAPCFFPDAFLEDRETGLRGGATQPLWVSVAVPADAAAGTYRGKLEVFLSYREGGNERFTVPITLHVWPFAIPAKPSLRHTEWPFPRQLAEQYHLEPWSEGHWEWLGKVARDMAAHRQNMILTDFFDLVRATERPGGSLDLDFRRLDRWIDIHARAGIEWIEGGHVAGRTGGWVSPIEFRRWKPEGAPGTPSPARLERYLELLLKGVRARLKARGFGHRYVQHIADEPIPGNMDSWKSCAGKVGRWLPGVERIDAVETGGIDRYCEIRVPQVHCVPPRTGRGRGETWCYVCVFPQGKYPNRFIDYPSIRNRIIFWLCRTLDLKGFLHWGYNFWGTWSGMPMRVPGAPWYDVTGSSHYSTDTLRLPSGDTHLVYPGRREICSSIRWEVIRKGMEDYELLKLLDEAVRRPGRTRAAARGKARELQAFIRREVAPDPGTHTRDDALLLSVRRRAGDLVAELSPQKGSGAVS